MAAIMSVLGLILSSYLYLRSAMVRFPFNFVKANHIKKAIWFDGQKLTFNLGIPLSVYLIFQCGKCGYLHAQGGPSQPYLDTPLISTTLQNNTAQNCAGLHCSVLNCTVLHYTVFYGTASHYIKLCITKLHCISLLYKTAHLY